MKAYIGCALYVWFAIVILAICYAFGVFEIGLGIVVTGAGVWFYNAVAALEEEEQL